MCDFLLVFCARCHGIFNKGCFLNIKTQGLFYAARSQRDGLTSSIALSIHCLLSIDACCSGIRLVETQSRLCFSLESTRLL